jgi:[acyl-carrier-protein] S-malonyltransferase
MTRFIRIFAGVARESQNRKPGGKYAVDGLCGAVCGLTRAALAVSLGAALGASARQTPVLPEFWRKPLKTQRLCNYTFSGTLAGSKYPGALMTAAFTFPGQGSQAVGMGKAFAEAFPAARAVFDEVDAALGEKLTAVIWDGPAETLQLTENAQPALMAVSLATMRVLENEAGFSVASHAAYVAGHSLGEYSALAAAGSLSVSDTARLLRTRGLAMQKAVPVGVGAMAALLGLANEAAQGQVCQAANDNGGGQVVVSGDKAAVERALEIAKSRGARRAMLLPVSAPFHCRLMQPAAEAMAQALSGVAIRKPSAPLISNVLAGPVTEPDQIRARLIEQVTGTVRWRESVAYMANHGVTRFFEIGAGKVLSGLVKRIADGAVGIPVGSPNDVVPAKQALIGATSA